MLHVTWVKSTTGAWLPLNGFDLSGVTASGVYYIWHTGSPGRTVRIGKGDVKDRLSKHRLDQQITQYAAYGRLLVTWAVVPAFQQEGVERFLANHYKPLVGDAFPNVVPIPVNLVA